MWKHDDYFLCINADTWCTFVLFFSHSQEEEEEELNDGEVDDEEDFGE